MPHLSPIDLGSPLLGRTLLRIALPTVGGLTINATHQGVDAYFVGQLGPEALAAVSLALPLAGVTAALGVGLGVGCATHVARALGAGTRDEAGQVASAAMGLCLLLATILAGVLWNGRGVLPDLLGAAEGVAVPAQAYLSIMAFSAALGMVQILCDFIAIGEGNARFSLLTLCLCFGLNILLDPLLIFTAGLGVSGAALATVLAQLATLMLYVWYFARQRGALRLRPNLNPAARTWLWPVLRVGLPEAGSVLLTSLVFVVMYHMAGRLEGAEGQAAMGIALRLWLMASLPVEGFCLGAQPLLSHAAGAGNLLRLNRAMFWIVGVSVSGGVLMAISGLLAPPPLVQFFTDNETVTALAVPAVCLLSMSLPAVAPRHATQVLLQATLRVRLAAVVALAPLGWLLLPLLIWSVPRFGFDALALSLAAATLLTGVGAALILWRMPRPSNSGVLA